MNKSLGIIIVNYNSGELLKNCIDSIFKSDTSNVSIKVVIIDNNSTDSSLELHRDEDDSFKIVKNLKNKGFGSACNQ